MATWSEIAIDNLASAKAIYGDDPRSSASRSYYAAHVALAERLIAAGYRPPKGRQTQPHGGQAKLVKEHLVTLTPKAASRLASTVSRLYARRIDADYKRTVTVDESTALDSLRDAASVLRVLEVDES